MQSIIGHQSAVRRLRTVAQAGAPGHAYLFTGPPAVGKTTLAVAFAQTLNCPTEAPPCEACRACRLIAAGKHPDVRLVEAENGSIKIDQVRELQHQAALAPVEVRWRVFIVPDVEQATREAANSLLKTLEEPPAHVVLLLTTRDAEALLPTVVSRCQVIPLRPLSIDAVRQALAARRGDIKPTQIELIARLSRGRIGWAITALEDNAILQRRQDEIDRLTSAIRGSRVDRLAYADRLSRADKRLTGALALWLSWWRDLMLVKLGAMEAVTNVDCLEVLRDQARHYQLGQIAGVIRVVQDTMQHIDRHVNTRLALEVMLLSLPQRET